MALYTVPGANLCRSTADSSRPRSVEPTVTSSTTRVVVFIPPAVEPGQPPINISATESTFVKLPCAPMSTDANPAVLVFTDWNSAVFSFAGKLSPSMVRPHSIRRKPSVPAARRAQVARRHTWEWKLSLLRPLCLNGDSSLHWYMSRTTTKPSPPMTISASIVRQTSGSPVKAVRLELPGTKPKISKPALQ